MERVWTISTLPVAPAKTSHNFHAEELGTPPRERRQDARRTPEEDWKRRRRQLNIVNYLRSLISNFFWRKPTHRRPDVKGVH